MTRRKTGSFFDQLLGKSSDTAAKLKAMGRNFAPPIERSDTPKQPIKAQPSTKQPAIQKVSKKIQRRSMPISEKKNPGGRPYNASGRDPEEIREYFFAAKTEQQRRQILISAKAYLSSVSERTDKSNSSRQLFTTLFSVVGEMDAAIKGDQRPINPTSSTAETGVSATPAKKAAPNKNASLFSTETQFSNEKKERSADVIIGLDFGTSCSKIIVHVPYEAGGPAFVVPFMPFANADYPQLVPTHLSQSSAGEYTIPDDGEPSGIDNLKLALMQSTRGRIGDSQNSLSAECERAVAYLALIFKFVRQWFLREQKEAFRHLQIDWQVNIGIPSASYEEPDAKNLFIHLISCAWLVSTTNEVITGDDIRACSKLVRDDNSGAQLRDLVDYDVIPEVAAEVAGYAVSKFRDEGLHLIVDVGAGTLDVCGFLLFENDGRDNFPLLTAEVNALGAAILDLHRKQAITGAIEGWFNESGVAKSATHPIADDPVDYTPNKTLVLDAFSLAEQAFLEKCQNQIHRVVASLKAKRDPFSSRWRTEGLPVFICGGGKGLKIHENLILDLTEWLKKNYGVVGAKEIKIPKPENLRGELGKTDYHRLAVAWGLSQPSIDIGECIPPDQTEDINPRIPFGHTQEEGPWWHNESGYVGPEQT